LPSKRMSAMCSFLLRCGRTRPFEDGGVVRRDHQAVKRVTRRHRKVDRAFCPVL
jgi:hypothetical protein